MSRQTVFKNHVSQSQLKFRLGLSEIRSLMISGDPWVPACSSCLFYLQPFHLNPFIQGAFSKSWISPSWKSISQISKFANQRKQIFVSLKKQSSAIYRFEHFPKPGDSLPFDKLWVFWVLFTHWEHRQIRSHLGLGWNHHTVYICQMTVDFK